MKSASTRELLATLLVLTSMSLQADQTIVFQDGTAIRMRLNRTLSSATASEGDNIDFEVLDDVKIGELLVIPKGASALGTVTEARTKKSMGRGGKLNVTIDYVRLPNGDKVPLRGVQNANGGGHVGAMTGAIVATSIVFFPAAPLFLFIKGKDLTIPKGHEFTVYVNGDTKLSSAQLVAPVSTTSTGAADATPVTNLTGKMLTNLDILDLKNGGLGDDFILEKVKTSPADYKLDTSDILALHKAGLSDAVIVAMVQASKR